MLDEHQLNEPVRFAIVFVVMSLAHFADLCELSVAERATGVAERLEGVLGLPRHDDVADESEKITFTRAVGEVARFSKHRAENFLSLACFCAEGGLVLLEHPLMLTHTWYVAAAEISKAAVFRLAFVILEGLEKCLVLHYRVVDLAFEKIDSAFHLCSH
jgi:hypothetical protein